MEEGQLYVQAETLYSNKHVSFTPRLVPSRKLSRREFRNCPTFSEPNYLFVLVRVSISTGKLAYLILSKSIRSYLQMESQRISNSQPLFETFYERWLTVKKWKMIINIEFRKIFLLIPNTIQLER